jgi:hypothetical protein
VGDEAEKIARMVRSIIDSGAPRSLPSLGCGWPLIWLLLRKALGPLPGSTVAAIVHS